MYEATFKTLLIFYGRTLDAAAALISLSKRSGYFFLKYLDNFEADKETVALLNGKNFYRIVDVEFCWVEWSAPKGTNGSLD